MTSLGLQRRKIFRYARTTVPAIAHAVLDIVADDHEWREKSFTIQTLLEQAIAMDDQIREQLEEYFVEGSPLLENLQNIFAWYGEFDHFEFADVEDMVMEVLAMLLERKITIHPILTPTQSYQRKLIFGKSYKLEYNIVGYRGHISSYYISAQTLK